MITSSFYIVMNIKTGEDFYHFGKFFLGSDINLADNIFKKLKGSKRVDKNTILYMELMETKYELPQNIQMISCTLDELAENCKIITKETFKFFNMEEL
jgi:hypothetical protein